MRKKSPRRRPLSIPKELLPRSGERLVIGRRAVEEGLRHARERVRQVYLVQGREPPFALPAHLEVRHLSNEEMTALAGSESHQGIAALVQSPDVTLKQLIAEVSSHSRVLIVALDSVTDPHNVGSVLRAAECFGAAGMIWSHNRGPGVTAVVSKTSAGASELIPAVTVSNLAHALRDLKESGFWVVAADIGADSVELPAFEYPDRTVLVLGSEGTGLRPLTRSLCDYVVRIPMPGRIASLNVSQASAVFLDAWARQASGLRGVKTPGR